ncbi:MAG: CapA family protein [Spirochaetes bacterium]|nr:MAG: CapA family protein [Spirochaetota bacterium]
MKKVVIVTGYFILIFLIQSCSVNSDSLSLQIKTEAGLEKHTSRILETYPLPDSIHIVEKSSNGNPYQPDFILSVLRRGFPRRNKNGGNPEEAIASAQYKVIEKTWYAPVTLLWDDRVEATAFEITSGALKVLPLEEITLPLRALPVDGLYPEDKSYPLVEEIVISLKERDFKRKDTAEIERAEKLLLWFNRIEETIMSPEIVWIGAVGDIMPGRGVEKLLLEGKTGMEAVFGDTIPVLGGHDLLLGNLEGAVTVHAIPIPKSYNFRFPPDILHPLREVGFDYLSVTNNHSYDYGESGFLDTLKYLNEAGIATSGAGENIEKAVRPWETFIKGERLKILSLGAFPEERSGFNGKKHASATSDRAGILWADERGLKAVEEVFSKESFNILMVHGGNEWHSTPSPDQKSLYRRLIDLGADLLLGSHPHYLQGLEARDGKLIAYSLGNFIFPGMEETLYGEDTLILSVGVYNGSIRYVKFTPVKIEGKTVSLDSSQRITARFLRLSEELNR